MATSQVQVRDAAFAICMAATGNDCVMAEKPQRPVCNAKNCRIIKIARKAIDEARNEIVRTK